MHYESCTIDSSPPFCRHRIDALRSDAVASPVRDRRARRAAGNPAARADGSKPPVGVIWDLSKRQLHPRLERFSYDLGASRNALAGILRSAAPPEQSAGMEQALSGLQVLQPHVDGTHVVVPIALEIPDVWLA